MTGAEASVLLKNEMWDLFVGSVIGQGVARTVHEHRLDGSLVIKVEDTRESFQNVYEWETWKRVEALDEWHRNWFAPCVAISSCGTILVQRRTFKLANYPDRVPSYLTDLKLENFGEYEGRIVAHDYGHNRLWRVGVSRRMQATDWIRR